MLIYLWEGPSGLPDISNDQIKKIESIRQFVETSN